MANNSPGPGGGGTSRQVIYLLTEKLPNARGVNREQLAMGKAAMEAIVKASGALKGAIGGGNVFTPAPEWWPPLPSGGPRDLREGIASLHGPAH